MLHLFFAIQPVNEHAHCSTDVPGSIAMFDPANRIASLSNRRGFLVRHAASRSILWSKRRRDGL
jgi:hypothetical protein